MEALIAETRADELMLTAQIYDHTARLRSFEIAAEVRHRIAASVELIAEDGGQRSPIRQLFLPCTHYPGSGV